MSSAAKLGWPNRISISRILLVAPFVACVLNLDRPDWHETRHIALGLFVVMAISDWLDGFLARRMNAVSRLGTVLDPIGDKLLIVTTFVILAVNGVPDNSTLPPALLRLPNWVVVAALAKDFVVMTGFVVIYLTTGRLHIQARRLGKWCTTIQLMTVLAVLAWPDLPVPFRRVPVALWWIASLMAVCAALDYVRAGVRFLNSEAHQTKEHA